MPPGIFLTDPENLTASGIRFSDRPARSESPYRLSYPGRLRAKVNPKINNARYDDACTLAAFTTGKVRGARWKGLSVRGDCRACLISVEKGRRHSGTKYRLVGRSAHSLVTTSTELSRLQFISMNTLLS